LVEGKLEEVVLNKNGVLHTSTHSVMGPPDMEKSCHRIIDLSDETKLKELLWSGREKTGTWTWILVSICVR
jgi:hypothetical protein